MDVRGRGEAALMVPSIAPRSTESKDFTKKRDGSGHVCRLWAWDVSTEACLLANIKFAGAHFGENSVVWGMKIGDFGPCGPCKETENGVILRKGAKWRHEVA